MTLNGIGEPRATLIQVATQAVKIELFTQWQTYNNGVHMKSDTFDSIDFRAIAVAALTGAGFEMTAVEAATQGPPVTLPEHRTLASIRDRNSDPAVAAYDALMARNDPTEMGQRLLADEDPLGRTVVDSKVSSRPYGLSAADVAAHGEQVQG